MKKLRREANGFALLEILLGVAIVIAIGLATYILYQKNHQSTGTSTVATSTTNNSVIMVLDYTGGLCASGNTCSNQYNLYADGTFQKHTKLTTTEVSDLKKVIAETDFSKYPKNPKPNCPSYVDGSDESLAFPQKYKATSFKLCELVIPASDPAITFINNLIDTHQSK
jgi:hypothetical protein